VSYKVTHFRKHLSFECYQQTRESVVRTTRLLEQW